MSVGFSAYREMISAYVSDPQNQILDKTRVVEKIEATTTCVEFWTVKIFYVDDVAKKKSGILSWCRNNNVVEMNIFVEQLVGWAWLNSQRQLQKT